MKFPIILSRIYIYSRYFVDILYVYKFIRRYVHRVGRTARAGCGGRAVTFVGDARRKVMKDVLKGDSEESTGKKTLLLK